MGHFVAFIFCSSMIRMGGNQQAGHIVLSWSPARGPDRQQSDGWRPVRLRQPIGRPYSALRGGPNRSPRILSYAAFTNNEGEKGSEPIYDCFWRTSVASGKGTSSGQGGL